MSNSTPISGIYIIVNTTNGKVYIGKAKDFRGRWTTHKSKLNNGCHPNRYLQRAWNKHTAKAFKFRMLEYCPLEELAEREKHHIAIYKARGLAYNLTDGGEGTLGFCPTAETRQKLSKARKGKPLSEKARRNMSAAQKGRTVSDERRHNISEAVRKHYDSPAGDETRRKLSAAAKGKPSPNKGKPLSVEARRKISESKKGKIASTETRQKMSKSHTGAKNHHFGKEFSAEHRRKLSEATKRQWELKRAKQENSE